MKRLTILVFTALVGFGSISWAQDRCVPFTGTINAGVVFNPVSGDTFFAGIARFSIEDGNATTETRNLGVKKGGPADPTARVWIGTELTTVTLESGNGFLMPTQFTAVQSVGLVNETGTITAIPGSTGKFANVHGHFTSHGPFGFGVPLPDMDAPAGYVWVGLGWIAEYRGNICGIK